MTGFVFKIQANMDPNHRDRIAFLRVCSGRLARGMKAKLVRTGRPLSLSTPQFFFAQDRAIADEAYAGDIVGIPNHGTLRIGDTLDRRRGDRLSGRAELRARDLAPHQASGRDEGQEAARSAAGRWRRKAWCSSSFLTTARPPSSASSAPCSSTCSSSACAANTACRSLTRKRASQLCRWIEDDPELERFAQAHASSMARDLDGAPVFMAASNFDLTYQMDRWPSIRFREIKAYQATMPQAA